MGMRLRAGLGFLALVLGVGFLSPAQRAVAQSSIDPLAQGSAHGPAPLAVGTNAPVSVLPNAFAGGRVSDLAAAAQRWDGARRAWSPVSAQAPVLGGDRLRVDAGSHLAVEIGPVLVVAAAGSEFEFPAIAADRVQIRIIRGSLAVRLSAWASPAMVDLLSDEMRAQALGAGIIRVDRPAGLEPVTRVTAMVGPARIVHPEPGMDLLPGQRMEVLWRAGQAELRLQPQEVDRFHQLLASGLANPSAGQAPPVDAAVVDVTPLDRHGRWERHPEYGAVWWPAQVSRDWEPYRDGRWVWVQPGHWVWWENAGWGMAPLNGGRWIQWRERWVWAPRLAPPRTPVVPMPVPLPVPVPPPAAGGRPHEPPARGVPGTVWNPAPGHGLQQEERPAHEERRSRIPRFDREERIVPGSLPPPGTTPPAGAAQPTPSVAAPTAPRPVLPAPPSGFGPSPSGINPTPSGISPPPSGFNPPRGREPAAREPGREPAKESPKDRRDRDRERER